jgi:hypothetical protein
MRTTIQRALTPVVISAVMSMGCSTTYAPREPGRISLVMSGGEEVLEKDGKEYKIGGFSRDLIEAVSGSRAAEEHARAYVRRQRLSRGLAIFSGVAFVAGSLLVAFAMAEPVSPEKTGPDPNLQRNLGIAGVSLLLGSLVSLAGAVALDLPEGDLLDAINIYNDDVASRWTGFSGDEHAHHQD